MTDHRTAADVLDFWLHHLTPQQWYVADDTVDARIRDQFLETWQAAHSGGCADWLSTPDGTLAYVILCDQFPRNIFRGEGQSFATDNKALDAAVQAIDADWDLRIAEPERQFIFMPFMHSERLADQDRAVTLFETRMPQTGHKNVNHARAHRWVIETFGRFPYRNDALARTTTPAEQAFLDEGGYRAAIARFPDPDADS